MSDNVTTQSTTPATPPESTVIATAEVSWSGDTAQAGVSLLGKSSGAEGARTLTLVDPATEGGQTTGNASLSSIDGKTPQLGQALAASSVPVVLTAAQISTLTTGVPAASTVTHSNVAASATNVTLLTAAARKGASFFNDSISACYLKENATATTSSFTVKIQPYQLYELPAPVAQTQIDCLWDSAVGSMRITVRN